MAREQPQWGKIALVLLGMMLLCAIVMQATLHDRLHGYSLKGFLFEAVAGTHAYNAVHLYGAMFGFIASLLLLVLVGVAAAKEAWAARSKAARKAARREAWEASQASAADPKADAS